MAYLDRAQSKRGLDASATPTSSSTSLQSASDSPAVTDLTAITALPAAAAHSTKRVRKEAPAWFQQYAATQQEFAENQLKINEGHAITISRLLEAQLEATKERNSILKSLTDALLEN